MEPDLDDDGYDYDDDPSCTWCSGEPWTQECADPLPGEQQCEADGVRNGPDGPGGTEHYWSCTAPGTVDVDGTLMCEDHAGGRGYGPKQEEYGFDLAPPRGGGQARPARDEES